MNRSYPMIAAAVATALGSGYASAAAPTLAQAANPTVSLVIAGSSAAAAGVTTAIQTDLCGGPANTFLGDSAGTGTTSKNFTAISCFTAVAIAGTPGIPANTLTTIYYRTEGGSVVGALPVATGKQIKRLNLSDASCPNANPSHCVINNGTFTNTLTAAVNDGWAGAVTADTVQLGVTDVEPSHLTNADYPSNYNAAVYGTASSAQLIALNKKPLYQQVFGLVVNTSGQSFTTVNLGKSWAAGILDGNVSDWSNVPDATTGNKISAASSLITRVDREPGSGTRTSANIYFNNYQCGSSTAIVSPATQTLNFSTGDELTLANSTAGSIAYTSIDQIQNPANGTKFTNLVLASINGVAPSNAAAADGRYDFWFEATLVPNTSANTTADNLSVYLQTNLPKLATAPSAPHVLVIPNVGGNVKSVPPTNNGKTGTLEIYVNPLTRAGSSCNIPG